MKIISKHKDYYDFCVGKFGIDEKVVYDRTCFHHIPRHFDGSVFDGEYFIALCGILYRILICDGEYYFGDEYELCESIRFTAKVKKRGEINFDLYYKRYHLSETDLNDKYGCPIVLLRKLRRGHFDHVGNNPILKEYGFHKIMPPEDCWVNISNWLSREKHITDNRTDKEKIVGHGFDTKTSFRKM